MESRCLGQGASKDAQNELGVYIISWESKHKQQLTCLVMSQSPGVVVADLTHDRYKGGMREK